MFLSLRYHLQILKKSLLNAIFQGNIIKLCLWSKKLDAEWYTKVLVIKAANLNQSLKYLKNFEGMIKRLFFKKIVF